MKKNKPTQSVAWAFIAREIHKELRKANAPEEYSDDAGKHIQKCLDLLNKVNRESN